MKAKLLLILVVSICNIAVAQTYELSFPGTGDKTMKLGKYIVGNGLNLTVYISGGWAQDGGVYHIMADWGNLPKVAYRAESSINNRLKFYAHIDPNSLGYCYLFATWDNQSPSESYNNTVSFFITSEGYVDSGNQDGDFSIAVELENILSVNSGSSNVGIGTNSPDAKLHIANGDLLLQNESGSSYPKLWLKNVNGDNTLKLDYNSFIGTGDNLIVRSGSSNYLLLNDNGGNVGIGTSTPSNKLDVAGTIRAEEVKVEAQPWPDYVFTDTYKLNSLSEVSNFISENGHLPNIPTAKEVKENGIKLGEMNAKLLEKIEELTLYLIEQNERLHKQNNQLQLQTKKIENMQTQIDDLLSSKHD